MAFPWRLTPMLATAGAMPADDAAWSYEFKWDGYRALAGWDGRRFALTTRSGNDLTARFPELAGLPRALAGPTLLDGEIVAFDARGRPSFQLLQGRFPALAGGVASTAPLTLRLVVFDLLHQCGETLIARPYHERRARLLALGLEAEHWTTPSHREGGGPALLGAARRHGLEGVLAKRSDGHYLPGRRSPDWIKIKLTRREEFVVGGFTIGKELDAFSGLLLGAYDHPGAARLRYAGVVGTGFSALQRRALRQTLERSRVPSSPFAGPVARAHPIFVRPTLVVEVAYAEITHDGLLRHPSCQGIRIDKRPAEVVRRP